MTDIDGVSILIQSAIEAGIESKNDKSKNDKVSTDKVSDNKSAYELLPLSGFPMGNGEMFACFDSLSLRWMGGYNSGYILSADFLKNERYKHLEVVRKAKFEYSTAVYDIKAFMGAKEDDHIFCDGRVYDALFSDKNVFIRHTEGNIEYELKLRSPGYVYKSYRKSCKFGKYSCDAMIFEKSRFERLYVLCFGKAKFEKSDRELIKVGKGESLVVMLYGNVQTCLQNGSFVIANCIFGEMKTFKNINQEFSVSSNSTLIGCSYLLSALQRSDGSVMISPQRPYVNSLYTFENVRAFLKCGLIDPAFRILRFFEKKMNTDDVICPVYFDGDGRMFASSGAVYANILRASVYYTEFTGDTEYFENQAFISKLIKGCMNDLHENMLIFCGGEEFFGVGSIRSSYVNCASLTASVDFIEAVEGCTRIYEKYPLKMPAFFAKAKKAALNVRNNFAKHFVNGTGLSLSCKLKEPMRKTYSLTMYCAGCADRYGIKRYATVELFSNEYYCLNCLANGITAEEYKKDVNSSVEFACRYACDSSLSHLCSDALCVKCMNGGNASERETLMKMYLRAKHGFDELETESMQKLADRINSGYLPEFSVDSDGIIYDVQPIVAAIEFLTAEI